MPAPAPYRLYDPEHRQPIETDDRLADEPAARAAATRLVEAGEYNAVEIHHLEDGLFGYDYYRIDAIESEIDW
jgi:hypothetical protein